MIATGKNVNAPFGVAVLFIQRYLKAFLLHFLCEDCAPQTEVSRWDNNLFSAQTIALLEIAIKGLMFDTYKQVCLITFLLNL